MRVYVIHENPEWYGPVGAVFDEFAIPHEQWLLGEGVLDLDSTPPGGVFWSRMSASAHTRGHPHAKDQARGMLNWLECHGRRVVNGRRVLELEMSKVDQHTALRAAGFDVPRTIAVAGTSELAAAASKLEVPFITKHNQGGKGLGVRLFASHDEFDAYLGSPDYLAPVDGITLLQEYLRAAAPHITRVEMVGGEFVYAINADTSAGGFELCPADACALGDEPAGEPAPDLFTLRDPFDHPIIGRYADFMRRHSVEVAGFEFLETVDGRLVTYDINTNTNYNLGIEAVAPRSALRAVAAFLARLLAEESEKTVGKGNLT